MQAAPIPANEAERLAELRALQILDTPSEDRFDAARFFRTDLPTNRELLNAAVCVDLEAGDVLIFHCRLLHAAGRNEASTPKYSLVFTYNPPDNAHLPGTRSARLAQIPL